MLSKLIVKNEEKIALVKDFLFHSTWNGVFLLKSHVSEIHVKRVNQGVGVQVMNPSLNPF